MIEKAADSFSIISDWSGRHFFNLIDLLIINLKAMTLWKTVSGSKPGVIKTLNLIHYIILNP